MDVDPATPLQGDSINNLNENVKRLFLELNLDRPSTEMISLNK